MRRICLALALFLTPALAAAQSSVVPGAYINGSGIPLGPIYAATSSDCSAPPYSFSGLTSTGIASVAASTVSQCAGATEVTRATTTGFTVFNHLLLSADNTYDIGASGATRPRTGYFGTSVVSPVLYGGGTTSSFPQWIRSSAQWQAKLADGSAFAAIRTGGILFSSGSTFDDTGDGTFRFTDSGGTLGVTHVVTTDGTDYCKSRAAADTCTLKANVLASTGTITSVGKYATYNNIATAGQGVPAIYGENISSTQTANFTALSYVPPATAGRYEVSAVITTTSATNTGTVQVTVDYVDSQGTTHTGDIIPLVNAAGTVATTATGASKEFHSLPWKISINNAATAIVIKVVVTGSVSYTVSPIIKQVA